MQVLDIDVVQYDQNMSSLQPVCALYTCMAQPAPRAAGYHRHLPEDETQMRQRGAKLNPVSIPKEGEGNPVYTRADDLAPLIKTDQAMRQYGRDSDAALIAGIKRKQHAHPSRHTGVHGSHALSKVPGWNEEKSRNPDPMHTSTNEVKSVTVMLNGGTSDKYSRDNLATLAAWELKCNGRWGNLLGQYRSGELAVLSVLFLMCLWGIHVAKHCRTALH